MEAAYGAVRGQPQTWAGSWLPATGLLANFAQSDGAWHVRGLPAVKTAFERIWNTEDLIVSMDVVIAWRPWCVNEGWRPQTEGLHLDQNPFSKPHLDCVQGMVSLVDVTESSGGLGVVPRSHLDDAKDEYRAQNPHLAKRGDWCLLHPADPMQDRGILLQASAGNANLTPLPVDVRARSH